MAEWTHPRWLYRPTDKPDPAVWDLCAEGKVFQADAIEAALAGGWYLHPNDFPEPGEDTLSGTGGGGGEYEPAVTIEVTGKRRGRPPKEG